MCTLYDHEFKSMSPLLLLSDIFQSFLICSSMCKRDVPVIFPLNQSFLSSVIYFHQFHSPGSLRKLRLTWAHGKGVFLPYSKGVLGRSCWPWSWIWLVVTGTWLDYVDHMFMECHDPNWRTHIFQRGRLKPPTSLVINSDLWWLIVINCD